MELTKLQAAIGAAAIAVAGMGVASQAVAAPINTTSNVVFIVDESGSMGGDQDFLENVVIDELDAGLAAAGVTSRSYGVVGYGGSPATPRLITDSTLDDAATTKANLGLLTTPGGFEDGWQAIDFALNNFNYTAGAAINFILVTDEDRDNGDASLSFAGVLNSLKRSNILLNAIVDNDFSSDNFASVLGIDDKGNAFTEQALGMFGTDTGGTAGFGFGTTKADYVDLALQSGGAAWDIQQLRAGGNTADSFTSAFIDIKVQEIISQPPSGVVPLPGALPLILSGFGAFGGLRVLRRRQQKAAA